MIFYLNKDMKFYKNPEVPPFITQFSTEDIYIHVPFYKEDELGLGRSIIVSIVRPDGYKTNEMFAEFMGENTSEPGTYIWKSRIVPFHTSIMPGSGAVGTLIMGFIMKEEGDIKSSPITKLTVQRSIEPNEEFLDYNAAEDLDRRINTLEAGALDHSILTLFSRSKANQHPIHAISGLKPKVEVHIGEEEPIEQVETWLKTIGEEEDMGPVVSNWEPVISTPNIYNGAILSGNQYWPQEALRLVVIGDMAGEMYRQELHSDLSGVMAGEVVLYVGPNYDEMVSFDLVIEPLDGGFFVSKFENTGTIQQMNFIALGIQAYRGE